MTVCSGALESPALVIYDPAAVVDQALLLRATELRYVATRILRLRGPSTIADVIAELHRWGFTVAGRPSQTMSDALRWEMCWWGPRYR